MSGGDITVDTAVMSKSRSNVPAISATSRPCGSLVRFFMDEQTCSKRGQRIMFVIIECTVVESRACRKFWIVSAVAKKIQGKLDLRKKTIPFFSREIGISTA